MGECENAIDCSGIRTIVIMDGESWTRRLRRDGDGDAGQVICFLNKQKAGKLAWEGKVKDKGRS